MGVIHLPWSSGDGIDDDGARVLDRRRWGWAAWASLTDANYYQLDNPLGTRGVNVQGNVLCAAWVTVLSQAVANKARVIYSCIGGFLPVPYGYVLYTTGTNTTMNWELRGPGGSQVRTMPITPAMVGVPTMFFGICDATQLRLGADGVQSGPVTALDPTRFQPSIAPFTMGRRPQPPTTNGVSLDGTVNVHGVLTGAPNGVSNAAILDAYNAGIATADIQPIAGATDHLWSAKRDGGAGAIAGDYVGAAPMFRVGAPTYIPPPLL